MLTQIFNEWIVLILPAFTFIFLFLILSIKLKKGVDVFSLCDFSLIKKKNKIRVYKTYMGYNFSVSDIGKTLNKAFRLYKKLIRNNIPLFSFEKEILKHSCELKAEYKLISMRINEYEEKKFFEGVPLSLIETVENINCGLKSEDKSSLDYKIARLAVLAGCYYISLDFSGELDFDFDIGNNFNYRLDRNNAALVEREKNVLKKIYGLLETDQNLNKENSSYRIKGEGRKNYLFTNSADLIADEFGNFAYSTGGKCVCEFGKFNFIKHFNFKADRIFFTDKFCLYENNAGNAIKICLDVNGNIILIMSFFKENKIFSVKILEGGLKFVEKTSFLHSGLIFEKCGEIVPYRLTGLIYSNAVLDMGIKGSCFNRAFKGALKALKYGQLFENIKIVTIYPENADDPEAEKIIKFIKIFNKFNYGFYVVAVSNFPVEGADEYFKESELDDEKILFFKNYSALFFDGKKIKIKTNFINKVKENNFVRTEPFFKIKTTRLKDLAEILYSVSVIKTDSVFNYCLKNISGMSKDGRNIHRQNILDLFKTQTLEGLMPDRFKGGFYEFKSANGLLSVFYYLICFINKYNERDILKENTRYSTFLSSGYILEESKIFDTVEYHLLAGIQYLLNSEDNLRTEIFKLFIFKKITPLVADAKIKKTIFSNISVLTKKIQGKLKDCEDKFSTCFFDYINLTVKSGSGKGPLVKIMEVFENGSLKNFERAVLELVHIKDDEERFLGVFLLKQFLTENILGIKFHKNLISFNPRFPEELNNLKIEINKTYFKIGYFGYSGVEIKGRRYYNYNYINLDHDGEAVISIG